MSETTSARPIPTGPTPVRAVDLAPADIVARPGHPDEGLIVIGVNPPAPVRRGGELVVRRLVSAAYDNGIGLVIPVFDDETILRCPPGTPVSPGPHGRDADDPSPKSLS